MKKQLLSVAAIGATVFGAAQVTPAHAETTGPCSIPSTVSLSDFMNSSKGASITCDNTANHVIVSKTDSLQKLADAGDWQNTKDADTVNNYNQVGIIKTGEMLAVSATVTNGQGSVYEHYNDEGGNVLSLVNIGPTPCTYLGEYSYVAASGFQSLLETNFHKFNVVDDGTFFAKLPNITQQQVDGDNNDVLKGGNVVDETNWENNKKTVTYQADNNGWYNLPGIGCSRTVNLTFTDNGKFPTVSSQVPNYVQKTITTPKMCTKSTTNNPDEGTYQVDQYIEKTQAMVNTVSANVARGVLPYRYDGPNATMLNKDYKKGTYQSLWGHSKTSFVNITYADIQKSGSLQKAIETKSKMKLGGKFAVGSTYTTAWKLASSATIANPWTIHPDTSLAKAQTLYTKVKIVNPTTTTTTYQCGVTSKTVTVQEGTKTVLTPVEPTTIPDPVVSNPAN